jgi:hypothetical protein
VTARTELRARLAQLGPQDRRELSVLLANLVPGAKRVKPGRRAFPDPRDRKVTRAQSARVARKGPRVRKATSPKRAPRGTAAS